MYGKRLIPRKAEEFVDLVLPIIKSGDIDRAFDVLLSYSKRKKRNPEFDHDTIDLLMFLCFYYDSSFSFASLARKFYISNTLVPEELIDDVNLLAYNKIVSQHGSVREFLHLFVERLVIDDYLCRVNIDFRPFDEFQDKLTDDELKLYNWYCQDKPQRAIDFGEYVLKGRVREMLDLACHEVRDLHGLKKITPKWKTENNLYESLKLHFKDLIVQSQASPIWLEGQRFDIWFPQLKLAVEYHGLQHFQPVDFFGGELGFAENQRRDELKRLKCEENDVKLIEVSGNFNLEKLIIEITSHYSEQKINFNEDDFLL